MKSRFVFLLAFLPLLLSLAPDKTGRFNENDLGQTLEALHADLRSDYIKRVASNERFNDHRTIPSTLLTPCSRSPANTNHLLPTVFLTTV